jgi:hypothetical protein
MDSYSISSVTKLLHDARLAIPLLLFLTWHLVRFYLSYRRLSHIRGPWLAGWSSLWLVGAVWRKQSHLEFYEVAKKYGQSQCIIVRVLRYFSEKYVIVTVLFERVAGADWTKCLDY